MLREKNTMNLIERIDRNIRIGFVVLFFLILIFALDDFMFSPRVVKEVERRFDHPALAFIFERF